MVWDAIRVTLRVGTALVLVLVLLWIAQSTQARLDLPGNQDASAIQIAQLYTQASFHAITAIGIGIAAYIGSRWE